MSERNFERLERSAKTIGEMDPPRHEGCDFVRNIIEGMSLKEAVRKFVEIPAERLEELLPGNGPEDLIED